MNKLDKKNIENILALTPTQEGILFHYLNDPEGTQYFEQLCLDISGQIDPGCFTQAWDVVVETNEMLRTVFRWEKLEEPTQIILKKHKCNLHVYDLTGKNSRHTKAALEKIEVENRNKIFDLCCVPFRILLCKIEANKYRLIISNHHILYDGWSTGIIIREFFQAYHTLSKERGKRNQRIIPTIKSSFKDFIQWIHHMDKVRQKDFWTRYLVGFQCQTRLPVKIKRENTGGSKTPARCSVMMTGTIKNQLEMLIKEQRVTLATFFYTAWGILLQRYCYTADIVFGTTVSGRSAPIVGIENMVGLFINTIPLRVKTDDSETIKGLLYRLYDILSVREEYESTPLVDIKEYSQLKNDEDLFSTIIALENYPLDRDLIGKYSQSPLAVKFDSIVATTTYDLTIGILIGEDITINFSYNRVLFDEMSIEKLSHHLINIAAQMATNPQGKVGRLEILSPEEKKQVLQDFNDTRAVYSQEKTLNELFAGQVQHLPDHIALIGEGTGFIASGSGKWTIHVTYRELNEKSNQLAHLLCERGVEPDTIVAIMAKRSVEMVIGILGILRAGGAYLPINPDFPQERINYMMADSGAEILLTSDAINRVPTPTLTSTCQVSPTNLAYLIYTSGSTGKPKGVMIEHRNVVNLVFGLKTTVYKDISGNMNIALIAPYIFDASVKQIFMSLLFGYRMFIVPTDTIRNGIGLIKYYLQHQIDISDGTPAHLQLLLEEETEVKLNVRVKYFLIGGESLSGEMLNGFFLRIEPDTVKIVNVYGPTECCVDSTLYEITKENITLHDDKLPIGFPMPNQQVYILNQHHALQPIGIAGEICISGGNVGRGYLNRPELTAEKFDRDLWDFQDDQDRHHRSYIYKTGDLARWLPDGNIEFLGRSDHQIKIRGFRIELEEIELALLKHPGIKASAVIVRESKINAPDEEKGEPYLCAYVVPSQGNPCSSSLDVSHLRRYLSGKLPTYMIPAYFVILEHLPLTSNGKLDRKALPVPKLNLTPHYVPPGNKREERLADIYSQILEIEKEKIGIDANFFELGGHSLKAIRLVNRIQKEFGIRLDLAECLKSPTIRQISKYLEAHRSDDGVTPILPVEEKEYYPLSSAQERLYTLQQMDRQNVAYNIFNSRTFDGKINRKKLEWAFRRLIHRHESLRTSFVIIQGKIVQRIHPEVTFAFERCSLPIQHFIRPFDLSKAPLVRVGLVTQDDKKLTLSIDIHHIITDGVSQALLIKELLGLCLGETLPHHRLRFKDFSHWQQQWKKEEYKQQEAFWIEEFQDKIPRLNMPIDFPRPEVQSFVGDFLIFQLNKNETDELKKIAREESVTSFMMLLAVYYVFLAAVSSQEDIVVGVPTIGRRYADLDNIIGMFVNTLALRNFPRRELTFRKLLKNVKTRTLKAFQNQDYQFDDLVERLLSTRDARRNPIFDVMFTFNSWKDETYDLNLENILNKTARFDLILHALEKNEIFYFNFEYSTRLYKKETIERFVVYLKKILSSVMGNPDKNISEIEIISDEEKKRLIRGIKNKDEKSAILSDHVVKNKAKGQRQGTNLTADFDF